MSSKRYLEQLVDILIEVQRLSDRAECKQLKNIIDLALYELGTQIAKQDPSGMEVMKKAVD